MRSQTPREQVPVTQVEHMHKQIFSTNPPGRWGQDGGEAAGMQGGGEEEWWD